MLPVGVEADDGLAVMRSARSLSGLHARINSAGV
jgi:hypothetical protein